MLELRRLHLLHQFAARGSISATAAALGYAPSAVSQQLAVLEVEAGVPLLERSARSATLTEAGRKLAAHAEIVLNAVEAAEADLSSGEPTGPITVGMIPSASTLFAPALAGLRRRFPRLELIVRQAAAGQAPTALHRRELDVAVIDEWKSTSMPGLTRVTLLCDPLLLVSPAGRAVSGVHGEVLLCAPPDQPSRTTTEELIGDAVPAARWQFEGLDTIAALVAEGLGVAILPESALRQVDPAKITSIPLKPARHRRIEAIVRESSHRDQAVTAVLDALSRSAEAR